MLSILIPVYNYNVSVLVQKLVKQIDENALHAEIIIVDDASNLFLNENRKLSLLRNVRYELLAKNLGRSAIRNYLTKLARFNSFLFIDCDAKVVSDNYLKKYYDILNQDFDIVCGGLIYQAGVPDRSYLLRWYYGKNRECKTVNDRMKAPYRSFSSFNFLIKKDVFEKVRFNEEIQSYGHEDTLLGINLKENRANIVHIDNPLLHDGLEPANNFIEKTESSVKNLKRLVENHSNTNFLKENITLVKYVLIINKIKLGWLIKAFYLLIKKGVLINLKSTKPSLILFDFYKIGFYLTLK